MILTLIIISIYIFITLLIVLALKGLLVALALVALGYLIKERYNWFKLNKLEKALNTIYNNKAVKRRYKSQFKQAVSLMCIERENMKRRVRRNVFSWALGYTVADLASNRIIKYTVGYALLRSIIRRGEDVVNWVRKRTV